MKLTPKQKVFADEYLIGGDIIEAAKKAGYSEKTARVTMIKGEKRRFTATVTD